MYSNTIGKKISSLRKKKALTQEELGRLVGVSGQAVSKWENGGVPDCMILPPLAKALDCTIDELFGCERKSEDISTQDLTDSLFRHFRRRSKCDQNEYFRLLFELIWAIQNGYWQWSDENTPLSDIIDMHKGCDYITSQIINDSGSAYLSLVDGFPLFCAVKDSPVISEKLLNEPDFCEFFSLFSASDAFKAVLFTQTSRCLGADMYTPSALAAKIGISECKFSEILPFLVKYGFLSEENLAIDESVSKVYHIRSNPEIRPMLMLAYQYMHARQCYYNFISERTKPFL